MGLWNNKIERAHRSGEKREDMSRTIAAKFSSYKTEEIILKNAMELKGTGCYINEDFPKVRN